MDGMGLPARMAARLVSCFQHPVHPLLRENGKGGFQMLNQEHEAMTTRKAGSPAAACADPARTPRHYLRRLAFRLANRAALRRAELRARAFELIAADRRHGGAA